MTVATPGRHRTDPESDIRKLIARIEALEALLACYRTDTRPSEELLKRVRATREETFTIRNPHWPAT